MPIIRRLVVKIQALWYNIIVGHTKIHIKSKYKNSKYINISKCKYINILRCGYLGACGSLVVKALRY